MNIILHGSFHGVNFGDTLLLKVFADHLRNICAVSDIFCTNTSDHAANFAGVKKIKMLSALNSGCPILFCGGGYLGEPSGKTLRWHINLLRRHLFFGVLAAIKKRKYVILGTGFGPLSSWLTRNLSLFFIHHSETCGFRDVESLRFFELYSQKENNCIEVADAILSCTPNYLRNISVNDQIAIDSKGHKDVLLHIPGDSSSLAIRKAITDRVIQIASDNYGVRIIAVNDNRAIPDFFDWMPGSSHKFKTMNFRDPAHLLGLIDKSYCVITTKLHVGICAAVFNKRVLSFPKHTKTLRLYSQLKRADVCLPISHVSDNSQLKTLVSDLIEGKTDPIIVPDHVKQKASNIWDCLSNWVNKYVT